MSWRRLLLTLAASLTILMSVVGLSNVAHANPNPVSVPPKEGPKVVLGDTSIDGPAILTTYQPATALAWTGTDALHHLNLMTSSDGLKYGNKHILAETSLWRPALAFIDTGRGAPYGTIVIAWTGTDANHTLNIAFIKTPEYTVTRKITFWGEWSFTAPALATINGDVNSDIYLSWAGTDPAHTVNVMHMSTNPEKFDKHILWGWSSVSRPNLAMDHSYTGAADQSPLILSWTGVNHRIYFAGTTDRVHWTMAPGSPLSMQTAWAPTMIGFHAPGLPDHWLAWTGSGTTNSQRINVQYTQHYPAWSDTNSKTTLVEWAISSPALTYNGDGTTGEVLLAWTGVDYYHHLNVAAITLATH